jgi:hypothetical protein
MVTQKIVQILKKVPFMESSGNIWAPTSTSTAMPRSVQGKGIKWMGIISDF